jgi:Fur family transcriptional regulator, peroxide stress response regulator
MRWTAQREAVFDVLVHMRTHPTADEIYRATRWTVPDISLATVYKTLDAFVACGAVIKLTSAGDSARFDVRTDTHHHFRCLSCDGVFDVEDPGIADWIRERRIGSGFAISGFSLTLEGHCADCAS